ncbi:MAG: hypothetical protein ACI9TI_002320 [Natronomonas sp.]|jgi:hypothetical protein|uniref:DUF5791 family protein n=1 Tax=Natronomonas sp. TaxID=2184060 RepID=UPI003989243F
MLHEVADSPGELQPAELHARYLDALAAVVDNHGVEPVAERSGLDPEDLRSVLAGDDPGLTLEESASILAVPEDAPDGETIAAVARDDLLMGMTTAVLDVEAVESGVDGELEAREIQSKIEGRFPMTLREFALLSQYVNGAR